MKIQPFFRVIFQLVLLVFASYFFISTYYYIQITFYKRGFHIKKKFAVESLEHSSQTQKSGMKIVNKFSSNQKQCCNTISVLNRNGNFHLHKTTFHIMCYFLGRRVCYGTPHLPWTCVNIITLKQWSYCRKVNNIYKMSAIKWFTNWNIRLYTTENEVSKNVHQRYQLCWHSVFKLLKKKM